MQNKTWGVAQKFCTVLKSNNVTLNRYSVFSWNNKMMIITVIIILMSKGNHHTLAWLKEDIQCKPWGNKGIWNTASLWTIIPYLLEKWGYQKPSKCVNARAVPICLFRLSQPISFLSCCEYPLNQTKNVITGVMEAGLIIATCPAWYFGHVSMRTSILGFFCT